MNKLVNQSNVNRSLNRYLRNPRMWLRSSPVFAHMTINCVDSQLSLKLGLCRTAMPQLLASSIGPPSLGLLCCCRSSFTFYVPTNNKQLWYQFTVNISKLRVSLEFTLPLLFSSLHSPRALMLEMLFTEFMKSC
jgi:hypothetical protein